VHFPVYRTYISALGRSAQDEHFFQQAMDGARQTLSEGDWPVLDCVAAGSAARRGGKPAGRARKILKHACVRFQQLTSPAAAKAVEDTAFYRSAVLLSRNDVGFNTEQFSAPVSGFHAINQQRWRSSRTTCWPPPPTTTSAAKTPARAWRCSASAASGTPNRSSLARPRPSAA
jgi:(1->4)-alpha-D-glucan 1-alpha-D-glucosylmutase